MNDRIGQTYTFEGVEFTIIAVIPEPNAEALERALERERAEAGNEH